MVTCENICWQYKNDLIHLYSSKEIDAFVVMVFYKLCSWNRIDVSLNKKTVVSLDVVNGHKAVINRLKNHEPIQYILEEAIFYNLSLRVKEGVLIPRPETEELVEWVLDFTKDNDAVLDVGTGSGCIALAIKSINNSVDVTGIDNSNVALSIAKENSSILDLDVEFVFEDILMLPNGHSDSWDIIVSNPPYIPFIDKKSMHKNVLNFEPSSALFVPDSNPLVFYNAVANYALKHLNNGGLVFFEIHEAMGVEILELLASLGFKEMELKKDMQGKDRMIRASFFEN
jgi:release factor glutamine methyltransferase